MKEGLHIILCDDHPLVLDGLQQILQKEKDVIDIELCNSVEALVLVVKERFEVDDTKSSVVLLLDLHLKDGDGLDVCKQMSNKYPHIKIIGLSGIEEAAVISTFLKNGGKSYLTKSSSGDEIKKAIRAVADGSDYLGSEVSSILLKHLKSSKGTSGNVYYPKLSLREKEILKLIVDENTTQEIAEKLFISVNTVETHRNHLLQKLDVRNVAGLVRKAIEKGLMD